MHYYTFRLADYCQKTAHLSNTEDLIYRRLIDLAYETEKPLPENPIFLARRIRAPQDVDSVRLVLNEFFTQTQDGWVHAKVANDIKKYRAQGEHGKKGAKARWNKDNDLARVPIASPEAPQCNPNSKPITNNQEPITNNQTHTSTTDPETAKARACVKIFQELIVEIFGESHRRLAPHPKDIVTASRWVKEGHSVDLVREALRDALGRARAQGKDPPATLAYFEKTLTTEQPKQSSNVNHNDPVKGLEGDEKLWFMRVLGFEQRKFWMNNWGSPPNDKKTVAPAHIIELVKGHLNVVNSISA
jgi:uncharacterized protein YdaU (DUF1376 family)